MQRAVEAFENDFARWNLHLPGEAIEARRAGQIRHAGWSLRYNFGRDARGEYLDYYASPRDVRDDPPGDDWHVRLYASGERAALPPVLEAYMYGRDPTWEELERSRRQYAASISDPPTDASRPPDSPSAPTGVAEGASAASALDTPTPLGTDAPDAGGSAGSAVAPDGEVETFAAGDASSDAAASYLPLDIGLHVELHMAANSSASSAAPEEPSPDGASPSQDGTPAELFYAPEDLAQFLPAPPEQVAKEPVVEEEEPAPPSVPFRASRDDTPAPITLETRAQEADPSGDIVPEEDEPPPQTLSEAEAQSLEAIDTVPLAEPDSLSRVSLEDEAVEGASTHANVDGPPTAGGTAEAPAPPLLAGTAVPKKIFRRADLVLTADVASIDPHVDPRKFWPWWSRPNARRAALAIAAVIVIAIVAIARAHHRAKADLQALDQEADTSAMNAPSTPAAATAPDSAGTSDTVASPDSETGRQADSATPVSAPVDQPSPQQIPDLRPPTPGSGDHNADDGMAKPAGPQSLSPIVPTGKAGDGAAKYPSGSFPRGYSP